MQRILTVLACLAFGFHAAKAQVAGGTISGTVTDPAGAAVPAAHVTIESNDTGNSRQLTTNSSGLYSAPNLTPGSYKLTVSAAGFSNVLRTDLAVSVGTEVVVNVPLQIGNTTSTIEVKESAPAVDAASSSTGAVVEGPTVRQLPLNGRDWTSLAALEPGVAVVRTQPTQGLSITRSNRGLGAQMTINGNRPQQNNYRLDGVSVNDYAGGSPASVLGQTLGVDAIQEFSVVTGNAPADYGKSSGAVVNAVTRAGTNNLHGSAYEFLRNSALDARNFFDGASAPPFKRNQFGGSAGGFIRRDKTFFFADYEGVRQSLGVSNVITVPTAAARAIVNPKVAPYLNLYPLPNVPLTATIGQYRFSSQNITEENFFTSRIDHRFSDKDELHGTFLLDNSNLNGPDSFGDTLLGTVSQRRSANLEESHIFAPTLINFARIGFNRAISEAVKTIRALNPAVADPSLAFIPGRSAGQINVTGLSTFQGGLGAIGEYDFHYNSYQAYDDLFWTKNAHAIKFGIAAERIQSNGVAGSTNGMVIFGSLANFLNNVPTSFTANLPNTSNPIGLRQTVFGIYMQDDWRVKRNLTLNLGLRYEMATVPTEEHNRLATLPSLGAPQLKIGSPFFHNPTLRDFSPRVGFSWDPFKTGKTAVRGGFGQYDVLPLTYEFLLPTVLSAPYYQQGSISKLPAGSFPDALYSNLPSNALRVSAIEQNPKRNYVLEWNLNVQHQMLNDLVLELGYSGSHGVHLPFTTSDANTVQPTLTPQGYVWPTPIGSGIKLNPNAGIITPVLWQVSSSYNALQARILKRLSHGFQIQGSYTFSKSLDTNSESGTTAFANSLTNLPLFDPRVRRGLSDFDIRHNFVANALWEIPSARTQRKAVNWAAGGWQLGTILQVSSGQPFTPLIGGDPLGSLIASFAYDYPDRLSLPGCNRPVNPGNPAHYINIACFAAPTPGNRLGNAGRNGAIGPGLLNVDTSLFKNNRIPRISETFNVQFRAEFFNVLNHTNFAPPNSTNILIFNQNLTPVTSAGALTTTSTTARQIQFAIKMVW
ncbi:MAG: TonB-dependent receptor domain-containing protein [Bryobacteraceae bacterium]